MAQDIVTVKKKRREKEGRKRKKEKRKLIKQLLAYNTYTKFYPKSSVYIHISSLNIFSLGKCFK